MASRSNLESRTYGAPVGHQSPGSVKPRPARNTAGEADPATRRRMLDQRLTEREPARYRAPPAKIRREPQTGVSPNTARLLRDRGRQIDGAVRKADK